jgi:TonB family protein
MEKPVREVVMAEARGEERRLRVACVWNGTFQAEELYRDQPVRLGRGPDVLFGLPADIVPEETLTLITADPEDDGWTVRLTAPMGGDVFVAGERRDVAELVAGGRTELPIGEHDYGVVTVGSVALFFQPVRAPEAPPRDRVPLEGTTWAALGLSTFVHTAIVLLAAMTLYELPTASPLELPTDLVARFLVTPPPEDAAAIVASARPSDADAALRARDEPIDDRETSRPRASGEPGAAPRSRGPERAAMPERFRGSLLDALGGGPTNPIAQAMAGVDIGRTLDGLDGVSRGGPGLAREGLRGGGGGPGGPLMGAGDAVETHAVRGLDSATGGRPREEHVIDVGLGQAEGDDPLYLSEAQIERVVRRRMRALRFCYELGLARNHRLGGSLAVQWRIGRSGRVTNARVVRSTLRDPRVEGCAVREIRTWSFPEPDGGEVLVTYPFLFGRGDE